MIRTIGSHRSSLAWAAGFLATVMSTAQAQTVHVNLAYRAPADSQPKPNFSPKGTQVPLTALARAAKLPHGAELPAKSGVIKVGPDQASWIPVLATSDAEHPSDLTRLYLDRNRNGDFDDDGPPLAGRPAQNPKTRAWWTSINNVELTVKYKAGTEPYLVNVWIVRDDSAPAPDLLRYSVGSWRSGTAKVNGMTALVAVMDDNDAIFDANDTWSVLSVSEPNAAKRVLSLEEARPTNRLMFLTGGTKDVPLEFRSISPDGRSIDFAVIDRPVTKAADRAPDDMLREERTRPRAAVPFVWGHGSKDLNAALARSKVTGQKIILDFEATWCGPCHTMDQWIWNDAEVAGELNAAFLGVKIDVDIEKALVNRFKTVGYPTMIVLDASGKEIQRVADYQSSKEMLAFLRAKR